MIKAETILLTVLIPTRNRPHLLHRALASVVTQKIVGMEICVVDNNPEQAISNNVKLSVDQFKKSHPDINWKYLHSPKLFASGARNDGMAVASGKYICFLDDDDELLEKSIEKRVNIMEADPGIALLYCGAQSVIYPYPFTMHRYYRYNKRKDKHLMMMSCSSAIINKNIFQKNDLYFDEKLSRMEDYDLFRRAIEKGLKIQSISNALVKINLHPDTRMSSNNVVNIDFKKLLIHKWGNDINAYLDSYIEGIYIWRKCFGLEDKSYKEIKDLLSHYMNRKTSHSFKIKYFLIFLSPMLFLGIYHVLIVINQFYKNRLM